MKHVGGDARQGSVQGASPSEAMLCRAANLAQLDQKEMLAIREAWFEEVGGPPTGNKCEPPLPQPHHSALLLPSCKQNKVLNHAFCHPGLQCKHAHMGMADD